MGLVPGASAREPKLGFYWQVFSAGDLSRLELLTPTDEESFLNSFLDNRAGGVHHITCQTSDLESVRKNLEEYRIPSFGYSAENPHWKELFIHPKDAFGVLIQIAEFNAADFLASSQNLPDERKWLIARDSQGCSLTIAHPGGGTATVNLDQQDIEHMIEALKNVL